VLRHRLLLKLQIAQLAQHELDLYYADAAHSTNTLKYK